MFRPFLLPAFCVLVIGSLSSCGGTPRAAADSATPDPAATGTQAAPATPISPEHATALKGFISASGGQCADIVSIEGEDLSNKVEVTCVEQAGAAGTVSYTVDLETEQVQKDG